MNIFRISSFIGVVFASFILGAQVAPSPVSPSGGETYTEDQMLEAWGWFLGSQIGLSGLDLTPEEFAAVARGMAGAARGDEPPHDLQTIGPRVEEYLEAKHETAMGALREANAAEALDFFSELDSRPDVRDLPSGLRYEILSPGDGERPSSTDTVVVHYTGSMLSGWVFDDSRSRGRPETVNLTEVLPGWSEGLPLIETGGRIKLYIPAHLAYGDEGAPGIPPGAALIFEIELVEVVGDSGDPRQGGRGVQVPSRNLEW